MKPDDQYKLVTLLSEWGKTLSQEPEKVLDVFSKEFSSPTVSALNELSDQDIAYVFAAIVNFLSVMTLAGHKGKNGIRTGVRSASIVQSMVIIGIREHLRATNVKGDPLTFMLELLTLTTNQPSMPEDATDRIFHASLDTDKRLDAALRNFGGDDDMIIN